MPYRTFSSPSGTPAWIAARTCSSTSRISGGEDATYSSTVSGARGAMSAAYNTEPIGSMICRVLVPRWADGDDRHPTRTEIRRRNRPLAADGHGGLRKGPTEGRG